jgi:hypothetical protein
VAIPDYFALTQTQFERAIAIGLARFDLISRDYAGQEGIVPRRRLHRADPWREALQETEMGDSADMTLSKQRQNSTCFDADQP